MKLLVATALTLSLGVVSAASAWASPTFVCKDNRVEKGGSTKYTLRRDGGDITVEKGGSSKGKAVKRNDKYAVEVGGSTKATIEGSTIYKGGSSWAKVEDAQKVFDCDPTAAATLWVLTELGVISPD